jgi:hypothetical protein
MPAGEIPTIKQRRESLGGIPVRGFGCRSRDQRHEDKEALREAAKEGSHSHRQFLKEGGVGKAVSPEPLAILFREE